MWRPRSARRSRASDAAALLGFAAITALTGFSGRRASHRDRWYDELDNPPFQPPDRSFAPVWTLLYGLIAVSGWRVYRRRHTRKGRRALMLWAAQLALSGMWPVLFFGHQRTRAALADCALLFAMAAAYGKVAWEVDRPAAALSVPYVGWVGFATLLNEEIVRRNRPSPKRHALEAHP